MACTKMVLGLIAAFVGVAAVGCGKDPVPLPSANSAVPADPESVPIVQQLEYSAPQVAEAASDASVDAEGSSTPAPEQTPAQDPAASTEPGSLENAAATPAETETASTPDTADTSDAIPSEDSGIILTQAPLRRANPFPRRLKTPDFPKDLGWINSRPLTKADLKGKFVLLDFWTYCCINCMHILPELKKLEQEFPNELVVIGVHSAKFETEKDSENIRAAVLRYEIEHPVVNDAEHELWDTFGVSSWPTILLIDPEGMAVWGRSGEFKAEDVREVLTAGIAYYRDEKLLSEKPMVFELEAHGEKDTPLRFPGKIFADEAGGRLFISDSNHNRLVIATLEGQLVDVIGSGEIGRNDGDYATASFNHPQGTFLHGEILYVADTENHLLRKVDLQAKTVTTIAGTGEQAKHAWPGLEQAQLAEQLPERWVGPPSSTALNSPWALWVHNEDLYIAMAGPHQIWKMPLDESEIGPFAGNGREDIVDGQLLPRMPYMQGFSSFAQPSGLSSDGTWLYVADSEGSSIRAVPFDRKKHVKTVVGSDHLDYGRLFAFGDKDGPRNVAKLQHCLEVVYLDGKLYVADTYNHKIKVVNAKNGETKTFAGTGKAGSSDEPAMFHEPAGLAHAGGKLYVADTNNHLIRTIDLATGEVSTLTIAGLTPPGAAAAAADLSGGSSAAPVTATPKKPSFKGAHQEQLEPVTLKPVDGKVTLRVSLKVPAGWKVNPLAPMSYWLDATGDGGVADRASLGRTRLPKPVAEFDVPVPVSGPGSDEVTVSLNYYYCQEKDDGVCKVGSVVFTVPLTVAEDASPSTAKLTHEIRG